MNELDYKYNNDSKVYFYPDLYDNSRLITFSIYDDFVSYIYRLGYTDIVGIELFHSGSIHCCLYCHSDGSHQLLFGDDYNDLLWHYCKYLEDNVINGDECDIF